MWDFFFFAFSEVQFKVTVDCLFHYAVGVVFFYMPCQRKTLFFLLSSCLFFLFFFLRNLPPGVTGSSNPACSGGRRNRSEIVMKGKGRERCCCCRVFSYCLLHHCLHVTAKRPVHAAVDSAGATEAVDCRVYTRVGVRRRYVCSLTKPGWPGETTAQSLSPTPSHPTLQLAFII